LFSINVAQVREVLEVGQITRIPSTPEYMRGVCNVRGHAIPILDLRMRLGLPPRPDTVVTRIIVMELNIEGEAVIVGGVADSVHEVIEIEPAMIHPAPTIAMRWRADFIEGMVARGEQFIIMLNVNAVFSTEEIALVEEATGRAGVV
jgi:purine-binding chemotaxis protein CheW